MTLNVMGICPTPSGKFISTLASYAQAGTVIYYRESKGNKATWLVLGTINQKGTIITNLLNINKAYDFQAYIAPLAWTHQFLGVSLNSTGTAITGGVAYNPATGQNGSGYINKNSVTFSQDRLSGNVLVNYVVNPNFHCK
jgi:hypothetical protein